MQRKLTLIFALALAGSACDGEDGRDGRNGSDGQDGTTCTVTATDNGGAEITCSDGTTATVNAGTDGTECTATQNGDGTITLECDGGEPITFNSPGSAFTLQVLHVADGEARADAVDDAPRFSAVLDALRSEFPYTVTLSSGDNFIAGPWASVSDDAALTSSVGVPAQFRPDIVMMNAMGFQASAVGNHEFDDGPDAFASVLAPETDGGNTYPGAAFPYLSANLDFRTDADLSPFVTADGQEASSIPGQLARSTVITVGGERIGIVGATTPTLGTIANTGGNIGISPADPDSRADLAAVIQDAVDNLTATGIDKIILLTHMQIFQVELDLAPLLTDVDLIIAGGSNTILGDSNDRLRAGDTAVDTYPVVLSSASAEPVLVANTDGSWRYVGRLVLPFNNAGLILTDRLNDEINGAYATDDEGVAAVNGIPNPVVQDIADTIASVLLALEGNIFGRASVFLNGRRGFVRTEETNMGNLTADANLWQALEVESDVVFSLKNGGGIRDEIGFSEFPPGSTDPADEIFRPSAAIPAAGKEEGDVSENDIAKTLAFNNGLVTFTVTAEELVALLENGVSDWDGVNADGRFPQIGGLRFSFDPSLDPGSRIRSLVIDGLNTTTSTVILQDGALAVDASRTFRGVTLDFLFNNDGNGYPFSTLAAPAPSELETTVTDAGGATFADPGSEQDALAEYLLQFYPSTSPFDVADTPIADDTRIQNLSVRSDTVIP